MLRQKDIRILVQWRYVVFVFCAGILLVVSFFAPSSHTAHAAYARKEPTDSAPRVETHDPLTDATVNLYCTLRVGRKTYGVTGSGVFVSERGIILTNAHVAQYFLLAEAKNLIKAKCSVRTGSPADERYSASVFYFPSDWLIENADELSKDEPKGTGKDDFALLYITAAQKGALPDRFPTLSLDMLGSTAKKDAVSIAGYPAEKFDFIEIRDALPLVTASSSVTNIQALEKGSATDILTLAASPAGGDGVSGGPVVDTDGTLLGIVTTKSAAKDDQRLRAITLSYIDRVTRTQTGLPFAALLFDSFARRASTTKKTVTSDIIRIITKALRDR